MSILRDTNTMEAPVILGEIISLELSFNLHACVRGVVIILVPALSQHDAFSSMRTKFVGEEQTGRGGLLLHPLLGCSSQVQRRLFLFFDTFSAQEG